MTHSVYLALVGTGISLADICFAAELALLMNEHARAEQLRKLGLDKILHPGVQDEYPRTFAHFVRLVEHEYFRSDLKPYVEKLFRRSCARRKYAPPPIEIGAPQKQRDRPPGSCLGNWQPASYMAYFHAVRAC